MISIAIDGPSGSGKGTIAKLLSKRLRFVHIDTGAMYRTIAYYLQTNNINCDNPEAVKNALKHINIKIKTENYAQIIFLNGNKITTEIRSKKISELTSKISAYSCVREFLIEKQRELATKCNIIMDGRDIGTVVLPNATVKIYLTASIEYRAKRRFNQLQANNIDISFDEVLNSIAKRDFDDSHRATSPLVKAPDAILFDSSGQTSNQTLKEILKIIEVRLHEAKQ